MEYFKKRDKTKDDINMTSVSIYGAIAVIFIALLLLALGIRPDRSYAGQLDLLLSYDDWVVSEEGENIKVELPSIYHHRGNTIRIENRLPRLLVEGNLLAFKTEHSDAAVYINGALVYDSSDQKYSKNTGRWNYIQMSDHYGEKDIAIVFTVADPYYGASLIEIYLGTPSEVYLLSSSDGQFERIASIGIVSIGIIIFIFSLAVYGGNHHTGEFMFLAFMVMALGFSHLFSIVPAAYSVLDVIKQNGGYFVYSLIPCAYCLYLESLKKDEEKKKYKVSGIISAMQTALLGIFRLLLPSDLIFPFHVTGLILFECVCAVCLFFVLADMDLHGIYRSITAFGLVCLMTGNILSLVFRKKAFSGLLPPAFSFLFALSQAAAVMLLAYEHMEEQYQMSLELSDSRLKLMVDQIKPHFIRGALGSIRSMIDKDPKKAYDLIYDFSNYLTFNIESMEKSDLVPFSEELKNIKAYAAIEEERFKPRIKVEYDIGADSFPVPPLSVQPYVENAIKHGVWAKKDGGTVKITSTQSATDYIIVIEDDGVGYDVNAAKPSSPGHGIGTKNSKQRIEALAGGNVETFSSLGNGTKVTIRIPKRRKTNADQNTENKAK